MNIEYGSSKEVKCYRDFVLNPDNRNASRAFSKTFGANLMEPAKKLHDRLRKYVSAGAYNAMFGQTDNRIEIYLVGLLSFMNSDMQSNIRMLKFTKAR